MKKIALWAIVALLWCCTSWATTKTRTWSYASPGGGGDFTCVSVSPAGDNVIVGGDVGGAWRRNGNSGTWTRMGKFDGFTEQSCINAVAICPWYPKFVVAGTRKGTWYSEDSGQSWKQIEGSPAEPSDGLVVTAVAWARDADTTGTPTFVLAFAYNNAGQAKITTATGWTTGHGPNTYTTVSCAPADDGSNKYGPIKIVFDPNTSGSTRDCYVLFGMANNVPSGGTNTNIRRDIYRSAGSNGTGTFIQLSYPDNNVPIDIVMDRAAGRGRYYVTLSSDNTHADVNGAGEVAEYTTDFNTQGLPWSTTTQSFASSSARTGALWYAYNGGTTDSSKICMLTVSRDACGSTAGAGLWVKLTKAAYNAWNLIDDGRAGWHNSPAVGENWWGTDTWENGWDDCAHARGETKDNPSHSISEHGEYWVTSRHVYYYSNVVEHHNVFVGPPPTTTLRDSTATHSGYKDAAASKSGSQYATLGIDNINPATIFIDSDGGAWVGYYDCGLWYGGGVYWTQKNYATSQWGWDGSGTGGNVNSIYKDADVLAVCEAPSSKTNSWQFWWSTNGGTSWTASNPGGYSHDSGSDYLRSIARDNLTGRMWVTRNGRLWYSDNKGTTWNAQTDTLYHATNHPNSLPSGGGFYTVASHDRTVVAGGSQGIWTSYGSGPGTGNGADNTWSNHDDLGGVCSNTSDFYKEDWAGIHDIYYDPNSGYWFAASWVPNKSGCTGAIKKGVLVSADGARTWSTYHSNAKSGDGDYTLDYYIRAVYADSCNGGRLHFTSAVEFPPGGPNDHTHINASEGSMTCRWSVDKDSMYCVNDITDADRTDPLWRYTFGGIVRGYQVDDADASGTGSVVYVAAQGNGPMYYSAASGMDGGTCPVERGGGEMQLRHPRQEAQAAPLELRRMFSVQEAAALIRDGKLELFDVSGRRTKSPAPGVYFSVKRDKAGAIIERRTVLVTR